MYNPDPNRCTKYGPHEEIEEKVLFSENASTISFYRLFYWQIKILFPTSVSFTSSHG
jgi:hypothetical protein